MTVEKESPTTQTEAEDRSGSRVVAAVDERLGLSTFKYPVPEHANTLGWSLGGLTATSLFVLIATGVLLTQYFNPTPEAANVSTRAIVTDVPLGEFTRSLHFWAAQAMYVLVALHLIRVFLTGSYKRPREGNWLIGVGMFALVIGAVFTGTVIKWDQEGFEALEHNLAMGDLLGGLGAWFSADFSENLPIIVRLYVAHVVIIPGLILALLVVHFLLVKLHGISAAPATGRTGPMGPFTHHVRRLAGFSLVLIGILGLLAVLFPPEIGPTPVQGIEITRPLWMFWWLLTIENFWGIPAILWGPAVLFGLLAIVPFVDRGPERYWRHRPVALTAGALVLVAMVVLTVMTMTMTAAEHL